VGLLGATSGLRGYLGPRKRAEKGVFGKKGWHLYSIGRRRRKHNYLFFVRVQDKSLFKEAVLVK
jgi:hypothetical protein